MFTETINNFSSMTQVLPACSEPVISLVSSHTSN